MQLPNKLYSYKNSTLAFLPMVLRELEDGSRPASELFFLLRPYLSEATDFLAVMDCLYALRAIDMTDEGEVFLC